MNDHQAQALFNAATQLDEAAKALEHLGENLRSGTTNEEARRDGADTLLAVLMGIIESVAGIGQTVRAALDEQDQMMNRVGSALKVAGAFALRDEPPNVFRMQRPCQAHQCPECGLPIGTNTSSVSSAGCMTCTEALQSHLDEIRKVNGTCPDCNCPLGENSLNCNTCARVAYV